MSNGVKVTYVVIPGSSVALVLVLAKGGSTCPFVWLRLLLLSSLLFLSSH